MEQVLQILHELGIDPSLILVNIVAFALLFGLLKKFAFGPISGILAARQAEIAGTLKHIQEDRRAMEQTRADYERRLANIEAEARERIQAAVKEAQALRDQIIQDARTEAQRVTQRAQEEIQREQQKALVELRTQIADLAVTAAGKIVGRTLDAQAHQDLFQGFITQVSQPAAGDGAAQPSA